MKKIIWKILRKIRLASFIQLSYKGILDESGWLKSFNSNQSIDKNGNPIPWCTYSFIDFIGERLHKEMSVYEYGSGNSTIWYANRVKQVKAVEHDFNWFSFVRTKLPNNAEISHIEVVKNGNYSKSAINSGLKYDVIIVDGRDRNNCVYNSIQALSDHGIIIFDNSQRENYAESQQFLKENGFKRIDFTGLCPVTPHSNTTTIFYRTSNCLGI